MAQRVSLRVHLLTQHPNHHMVIQMLPSQNAGRGGQLHRQTDGTWALIRRYSRSALPTDSESGNTAARSGSRTMRLDPSATRLAYFPRTPSLKSYSARIKSPVARGALPVVAPRSDFFFINKPFSTGGEPSVDDPDVVATLDMGDNEHATTFGYSGEDETLLSNRMIWIGDCH